MLKAIAVGAILLAIAFLGFSAFDRRVAINYYRIDDSRTIALGVTSGPGGWAHLTTLSDTPTSLIVSVNVLSLPLPAAGGDRVEITIRIPGDIGARKVIDASYGGEVLKVCGNINDPYSPCPSQAP